jgi:hypothetical protein
VRRGLQADALPACLLATDALRLLEVLSKASSALVLGMEERLRAPQAVSRVHHPDSVRSYGQAAGGGTFLETAEELLTHAAQVSLTMPTSMADRPNCLCHPTRQQIHSTVKATIKGQMTKESLSVCQTHMLAKVSFAQATSNSAVADFSLNAAFGELHESFPRLPRRASACH